MAHEMGEVRGALRRDAAVPVTANQGRDGGSRAAANVKARETHTRALTL